MCLAASGLDVVASVAFLPETIRSQARVHMVGSSVLAVYLEGEEKPTLLAGEQILGAKSVKAADWRWA